MVLPCWGGLVAQRLHPTAGLDVDAFRNWALVTYKGGRAASTVKQHVRQISFIERAGVDWTAFLSSPAAARAQADAFLAPLVLEGRREAVRNYKKTLNWVAAFHAVQDHAYEALSWPLRHAQSVQPRRLTYEQVLQLVNYRHVDVVLERRRLALVWFIVNTGLRRGEIGDIRLEDLDEARSVLFVGRPRKDGRRREIPLPDSAWDPAGPLQRYLAVRVDIRIGMHGELETIPWLWTTDYHGPARRMTGDTLYNTDLADMSRELGFRISFTNVRHWRGKTLRRDYKQPLDVVQAAYGHNDPKTTLTYTDSPDAEDLRSSYEAGGLPGFRSSTPRERPPWPEVPARRDPSLVIEVAAPRVLAPLLSVQKGGAASVGL